MIRRPPRSTLFPTRRSSDLAGRGQQPSDLLELERAGGAEPVAESPERRDRKSTRLNSSHLVISYAVFCLKKKKQQHGCMRANTQHVLSPDKLNHAHRTTSVT